MGRGLRCLARQNIQACAVLVLAGFAIHHGFSLQISEKIYIISSHFWEPVVQVVTMREMVDLIALRLKLPRRISSRPSAISPDEGANLICSYHIWERAE